ncbi:unnamed protein product [marine sediment metagenome]|uniref:Uncharacterized protein n=1 Tax=marine sediment metagenome TaxID=412755 RepID=X0ZP02_9ZZZZ
MSEKMVKLPKEMQKKEKNRPTRPQATKKREGQQYGSRQMRRRMQQQGIDMDQIDATRVIIEGPDKTLVIEQPINKQFLFLISIFFYSRRKSKTYGTISSRENDHAKIWCV